MRDRRTKVIDAILDVRGPNGHGVGIYGIQTCQVCGESGSFSGWAGAMASHRGGVFIDRKHGHSEQAVAAALAEGAPRFPVVGGRESRFRFIDRPERTIADLRRQLDSTRRTAAFRDSAPSRELAVVRLALRWVLDRVRLLR